ncbi:MAG: C39 family peptidase [Patescibacteria group bacterium]|nr:C39 family peptidase [Patescibacteria group bacterium]
MLHYTNVPYYSQFQDMPEVQWRQESCGLASLAMEIQYYKPKLSVSLVTLLKQALADGAYEPSAGWKHLQLAEVADQYGLVGSTADFTAMSDAKALAAMETMLADGPVIASIHNKFNPNASLGHLVVVTGFTDTTVYYHDPASTKTEHQISVEGFLRGWKKMLIVVRDNGTAPTSIAATLTASTPSAYMKNLLAYNSANMPAVFNTYDSTANVLVSIDR